MDTLEYDVPPGDEGILLKTALKNRLGLSRRLLAKLKREPAGITVNGVRLHLDTKLMAGQQVRVVLPVEESSDIWPQSIPFDIIYEDQQLLIVNKAAGMIVHPTTGHYTNTLANGVVEHWRRSGEMCRFRPAHRLDRDTSGVIAIAKNAYVHQQLSEQMQRNEVEKKYTAYVQGVPEPAEGKVDAPIDRDPDQPHYRIVTPSGYPSLTHYAVEAVYPGAARIELRLETGRTHQIRVHMKHIGHPLLGDEMYGGEELPGLPLSRHALHASSLGLVHPHRKEWMQFQAEPPEDLLRLEAWLKAQSRHGGAQS